MAQRKQQGWQDQEGDAPVWLVRVLIVLFFVAFAFFVATEVRRVWLA